MRSPLCFLLLAAGWKALRSAQAPPKAVQQGSPGGAQKGRDLWPTVEPSPRTQRSSKGPTIPALSSPVAQAEATRGQGPLTEPASSPAAPLGTKSDQGDAWEGVWGSPWEPRVQLLQPAPGKVLGNAGLPWMGPCRSLEKVGALLVPPIRAVVTLTRPAGQPEEGKGFMLAGVPGRHTPSCATDHCGEWPVLPRAEAAPERPPWRSSSHMGCPLIWPAPAYSCKA